MADKPVTTDERLLVLQQRLPNVPVKILQSVLDKHPDLTTDRLHDFFLAKQQQEGLANGTGQF